MIPVMPYIAKSITLAVRPYLELSYAIIIDGAMLNKMLSETFIKLALPLGLFFGALTVAALFAGFAQTRGNISLEKIKPKLEKISIAKGAKRMFSKNSIVELLKGVAKIVLIAGSVFLVLNNKFLNLQDWAFKPLTTFLPQLQNLVWLMMLTILCILFIIAGADYIFQRMEHKKKLKMSRHDVKEEMKKLEGNR
jgi:flagellar biosynthetic protein FlhB